MLNIIRRIGADRTSGYSPADTARHRARPAPTEDAAGVDA
jgi:hypothetical protein